MPFKISLFTKHEVCKMHVNNLDHQHWYLPMLLIFTSCPLSRASSADAADQEKRGDGNDLILEKRENKRVLLILFFFFLLWLRWKWSCPDCKKARPKKFNNRFSIFRRGESVHSDCSIMLCSAFGVEEGSETCLNLQKVESKLDKMSASGAFESLPRLTPETFFDKIFTLGGFDSLPHVPSAELLPACHGFVHSRNGNVQVCDLLTADSNGCEAMTMAQQQGTVFSRIMGLTLQEALTGAKLLGGT